jgi:tetratricopeptide (TPR) repeat protein
MKLFSFHTLLAATILMICAIFTVKSARSESVPAGEADTVTPGTMPQMQEIKDAVTHFKDRDIDGTVQALEAASKKNPDLPPPYVLLAVLYNQANSAQGALQALETGIQKNPDDPEAYVYLADMALRDHRIAEADLLLNKANSLLAKFNKSAKRKDTMVPVVTSGLARVAQANEDWPTAQKYWEQCLKLDPKNATAMQQLAMALFKQKKTDDALQKLRDAKKTEDKSLTPEAMLALFYQQAGDKENAKKWMAAALKAAPKDLNTLLLAAKVSVENGEYDDAKDRATAAMQVDQKSLDAKNIRGEVALFQKDYKAAQLFYESAIMQSPRNFTASNNLALALVEQNEDAKKQRAREYAESNVLQYKNSAEAASTYGWVLYKLNKVEDADKALQNALSGGSVMPDTAYYAAVVANERGRKEEAIRLLTLATKSKLPFTMKQEATALLNKLNK